MPPKSKAGPKQKDPESKCTLRLYISALSIPLIFGSSFPKNTSSEYRVLLTQPTYSKTSGRHPSPDR